MNAASRTCLFGMAALFGPCGAALAQGGAKSEIAGSMPALSVRVPEHGKCTFHTSLQPEQLMPGQSGNIRVVIVLEGDTVVEAPAAIAMRVPEPAAGQPPHYLSIGAPEVHPAQQGTVAEAYLGRPVYDNVLVVDLPVVMSTQAPMGTRQSVELLCDLPLHQGSTGNPYGTCSKAVLVSCVVGGALAPGVVAGAVVAASSDDDLQTVEADQAAAEQEAESDAASDLPIAGAPVRQSEESSPPAGKSRERAGGASVQPSRGWLLWLAAGACAVLLSLLVAKSRRLGA